MIQQLTIELSPEVFAAIQRTAAAQGVEPAALVASSVSRQFTMEPKANTGSDRHEEQGRGATRRLFGTVAYGSLSNRTNAELDEELAQAYDDAHEAS